MLSAKQKMNRKRRMLEAQRQSDEWDLFQDFFTGFFKGGKKKDKAQKPVQASSLSFSEDIRLIDEDNKKGKAVSIAITTACVLGGLFVSRVLLKKFDK